jgi:putative DNA primase/helicase
MSGARHRANRARGGECHFGGWGCTMSTDASSNSLADLGADDAGWAESAREYHASRSRQEPPPELGPLDDLLVRASEDAGAPFEASSVEALARLRASNEYEKLRAELKATSGVRVAELDKVVNKYLAQTEDDAAALPHWNVEPWDSEVDVAVLLGNIENTFRRYIVLPKGAAEALALWTLHAWTMDAGDISPFMVLVSPTKRCGKTSVLIVLLYLTPRSELASNISASALFRYIEQERPTLLIDEADSFVKDNEEMRGILNSGHTRAAAHVIRNVEVSGEHKPRRFSTWAPKAIATIRALADTLDDRAVVVQLQRKPKTASVARLRRRDSDEFAVLRRQAARWAADNFKRLTDPEPNIPEALNDRAADNWRPLLAIADLAGGTWPRRARDAACLLSGEGHDSTSSNVELLVDIRKVFGDDNEVTRSADLVSALVADPERPWAEWSRGKPLTQKQLGGLLRPFGISSETVSIPGQNDAKGYKRVRFAEAWAAYCPGHNSPSSRFQPSEASKRRDIDEIGTISVFSAVAEASGDASKNTKLSHGHAASDASTLRNPVSGAKRQSDRHLDDLDLDIPTSLRRCDQCGQPATHSDPLSSYDWKDRPVLLHGRCEALFADSGEA